MIKKQKNLSTNLDSIFIIIGSAALVYLLWQLSSFILLLITALMLAATLMPAVDWLSRRIHQRFSAALVTIFLVIPVIVALVAIVPIFLDQVGNIGLTVQSIVDKYPVLSEVFKKIDIAQYANNAGTYLWTSTKLFGNFVTQMLILLFMVYYLMVDVDEINKLLTFFIPQKYKAKTTKTLSALAEISGQYIRGNILISLICATVTFIGLLILKVPGALALAIFAGIMDLLPLVGATIGAIPAVVLGFTVSPMVGIFTIGLFWLYQQFENNVITPKVYSKALKIIPFLSFTSVIVGTMLFGLVGAFLALPIAASIPTLVQFFSKDNGSNE
jgi:predicted PurR-regulated permease PerM